MTLRDASGLLSRSLRIVLTASMAPSVLGELGTVRAVTTCDYLDFDGEGKAKLLMGCQERSASSRGRCGRWVLQPGRERQLLASAARGRMLSHSLCSSSPGDFVCSLLLSTCARGFGM